MGNVGWVVGVCVAIAGCNNKGASSSTAPPAEAAPPVAEPAPAAPAPVVKATVRGGTDDAPLSADIAVTIGEASHTVVLGSDFEGCESSEAPVDAIPGIDDPRLRMVQLFCENGEDMFTRQIVTALLVADATPWIAWKGTGRVSTADGECESAEVPAFRAAAGGKLEAVIESGCGDDTTTRVVATLAVPAPGTAPPPLEWKAAKNKVGDCTELAVEVSRGGNVLDRKVWKDECEHCTENSCNSTFYEHQGWVDAGGERFAWIVMTQEWHDNGAVDWKLWGYPCGRIAELWTADTGPGSEYAFEVVAGAKGWRELDVTMERRHMDQTDKETTHLAWNPTRCVFDAR